MAEGDHSSSARKEDRSFVFEIGTHLNDRIFLRENEQNKKDFTAIETFARRSISSDSTQEVMRSLQDPTLKWQDWKKTERTIVSMLTLYSVLMGHWSDFSKDFQAELSPALPNIALVAQDLQTLEAFEDMSHIQRAVIDFQIAMSRVVSPIPIEEPALKLVERVIRRLFNYENEKLSSLDLIYETHTMIKAIALILSPKATDLYAKAAIAFWDFSYHLRDHHWSRVSVSKITDDFYPYRMMEELLEITLVLAPYSPERTEIDMPYLSHLFGLFKSVRGGCSHCPSKGSLKCGRCLVIRYCSADCQRAAWNSHKKYCKVSTDPISDARKTVIQTTLGGPGTVIRIDMLPEVIAFLDKFNK